jgi:hypothetical protein
MSETYVGMEDLPFVTRSLLLEPHTSHMRKHLAFLIIVFMGATAHAASNDVIQWFQKTEQSLMDAIASGDKAAWDRVLDPSFILTSEEGEVMTRAQFLAALRPLPKGLSGTITVKELTVQQFPSFAVARFLADESEQVFGQRLTTKYRVTDTYRPERDKWKMVASHVAVVTQDPPAQNVSRANWPALVGIYQLLPDGWTFIVELRDGTLYGGRDPKKLRPLIPLTPDVFVLSGSLGEWMFVVENGSATRIVNLRKFEPLVWTRVE